MEALKKNHFEFLSLPARFAVDSERLEQAYRRIQSSMHPDRFVRAGDAEKRMAMQLSTKANQAYQTLRDPLARARYLCEINGIDVGAEDNTAMPPEFLMAQMSCHEALDEWRESPDPGELDKLIAANEQAQQQIRSDLTTRIDEQQDYAGAAGLVRQYMFLARFAQQLQAAERQVANS